MLLEKSKTWAINVGTTATIQMCRELAIRIRKAPRPTSSSTWCNNDETV